jgi:hypothetical protein
MDNRLENPYGTNRQYKEKFGFGALFAFALIFILIGP